jgi:hypothetical protein
VGQEGYFMLHKPPADVQAGPTPKAAVRAAAVRAPKDEVYTLLHAEDFCPLQHAEAVQAVIQKRSGSIG